jgi:hypothetical protein
MSWKDGRAVECGGLENRCPGDWTGGSNPSLSAKQKPLAKGVFTFYPEALKFQFHKQKGEKKKPPADDICQMVPVL